MADTTSGPFHRLPLYTVPLRVETSVYDGPIDLLLHLVRQRELDICDVSLAKVAGDFLACLRGGQLDPDEAGAYLVVAATLVELKSVRLLPVEDDRRERSEATTLGGLDLVRQLLDYQRLRKAADRLDTLADDAAMRHVRAALANDQAQKAVLDVDDLTLDLLVSTYRDVLGDLDRRGPTTHDVADDERPAAVVRAEILDQLLKAPMPLRDLLAASSTRGGIIATFLVILEMLRDRRISLTRDLTISAVNDEADDTRRFDEEAGADGPRSATDA